MMYDYKYLLCSALNIKDGEYTTDEINFGVANPNLGRSGMFGLHIVVTTVIAGATEGIYIWVNHDATTTPTVRHVGRFFTLASLVAGSHWYIPCGHSLLQYARASVQKHTTDVSTGNFTMWFGPDEDGTT